VVPGTDDGEDCLFDITVTDPAPIGGIKINVTKVHEKLCPGQKIFVAGPTRSFSQAPEGYVNATVEARGYYTNTLISASDSASVSIEELVQSVFLTKWAGPPGDSSLTGFNRSRNTTAYTVPSGAQWARCYRILIDTTSEECMLNITLTDAAPNGGTNGIRAITTGTQTMCPGVTRYISGPFRFSSAAPEGFFHATLTGVGVDSGI